MFLHRRQQAKAIVTNIPSTRVTDMLRTFCRMSVPTCELMKSLFRRFVVIPKVSNVSVNTNTEYQIVDSQLGVRITNLTFLVGGFNSISNSNEGTCS